MKTHRMRADGDSHFTVCGLDDRKRTVLRDMHKPSCKACNGQQNRHSHSW